MEENLYDSDASDFLTLVDEEGTEHKFEVIDTLEIEDVKYIALIPAIGDDDEIAEEDSELVILRIESEDGQDFLEAIDNKDEFDVISKMFMERLSEFFDIVEED